MRIIIFHIILQVLAFASMAQQPELVLPSAHSGIVRLGRFSPDNRLVITGGEDRNINVWETFTGIKLKTLYAGLSPIRNIGFTPGGKNIFAQTDSSIVLWSVPSYRLIAQFRDVRGGQFSPDGQFIYTVSFDGSLHKSSLEGRNVWTRHVNGGNVTAVSEDGSRIAVISDTTVIIVADIGEIRKVIPVQSPMAAYFLPANGEIVIINGRATYVNQPGSDSLEAIAPGTERIYISQNGRFLARNAFVPPGITVFDLHEKRERLDFQNVYSRFDTLSVPDSNGELRLEVGKMKISVPGLRAVFNGVRISNNGRYMASDENLWVIDEPDSSYHTFATEDFLYPFNGSFSDDSKFLLLSDSLGQVSLWDLATKSFVQRYRGITERIHSAAVDSRGTLILSIEGNICKAVLPGSGKTVHVLNKHTAQIGSALFSRDGTRILTNSFDTTACLWDARTGRLIEQIRGHHYELNPVYFDHNDELVRPDMLFDSFTVVDPVTMEETAAVHPRPRYNPANLSIAVSRSGKYRYIAVPLHSFLTNSALELSWDVEVNAISPDEKIFVMGRQWTDSIMIGDPETGQWLKTISSGMPTSSQDDNNIRQLLFSPGGEFLIVTDRNRNVTFLDVKGEFRPVRRVPGEHCSVSEDGDLLVIVNAGKLDVYDASDLSFLYSYVSMGRDDYLVVDELRRYDGTVAARKYLYFTCENEIIGVNQFKDRLWVPGLAGRIIARDSIYTPGIDRLNICGYAPRIQSRGTAGNRWEFLVQPGTGGLGETAIYVNGVEVKRVPASRLMKSGSAFILQLDSAEIVSYYAPGQDNSLSVRSFVADNSVSSRGFERKDSLRSRNAKAPSLYAVMIGVSDYKGSGLDLKYAAKDASDLAAALKIAASKLLNTDGSEHVFVYRVTTDQNRFRMPEKIAIQKTIEEIGKKATPNDILLIFFAGHGVMHEASKQFYFLTSEASENSSGADLLHSGISTAELIDWIKPSVLKAQKRILIFDACNSGQAIRELVKVGEQGQGYVSARNDGGAQQVKLIEKLNERAGFTILSAAASDQSAYEFGEYSQGLLTYALLKAVKETPDVLVDGKYLDVGRWFQAAGTTVEQLIQLHKLRQDPQLISNTNFIIGLVDREVLDSIHLPSVKKAVVSSIIIDPALGFDRLGISKKLDAELAIASAGNNATFIFRQSISGDRDLYALNGIYTMAGEMISLKISLVKDREIIDTLQLEGKIESVDTLVRQVVLWLQDK